MDLYSRKNLAATFAPLILGALVVLTGTPAHAQNATLRLMPIGDSITSGFQSSTNNGYRGPLWTELEGQGDALDMVGSLRDGTMFDPDHEGHSGYRIDQVAALLNGPLAEYQPNLITLHIGTNDMGQNYQVSTAPARLGSLIDQIFSIVPNATVVVAQLICNATPSVQSLINTYNSQIPGIVQARVNAGKHVYMVSMSSLTTADLQDGLHPNDGGYQKMADAWDAAIQHVISIGWVSHIAFAGAFEIQNANSGLALDDSGYSTTNGGPIVQWAYNNGSNQLWNFIPTSGGYYQIRNCFSAQDLNVTGASTANGASIVQWPFGSEGNDQWLPVRNADGSYVLYNRNSGLALDDPGWSVTQGTQLDQWGANGGTNQNFWVGEKY